MWQDLVFSVGSVIFAIALLPSVLGPDKPDSRTSFLTGGILLVYVVAFATLGLWYAALTDAVVAVLWLILWGQKVAE